MLTDSCSQCLTPGQSWDLCHLCWIQLKWAVKEPFLTAASLSRLESFREELNPSRSPNYLLLPTLVMLLLPVCESSFQKQHSWDSFLLPLLQVKSSVSPSHHCPACATAWAGKKLQDFLSSTSGSETLQPISSGEMGNKWDNELITPQNPGNWVLVLGVSMLCFRVWYV